MWENGYKFGKTLIIIPILMHCYVKVASFLGSRKKVDLLVTMFTTSVFLADHFDCPVVLFSPIGPFPDVKPGTGITINLSLKPHHRGVFIEPMTFTERVINHIQYRQDQC